MLEQINKNRVSVVVISYNTREKLLKCLSHIEPDIEIIVVDNNSADGSADAVAQIFPKVKLIRNLQNAGFGAANNLGSTQATGDLIFYLNSDAYVAPGTIQRLADEFEDSEVVGVGPRLLNPDGSLQESTAHELTLWAVFCEQFYLERLFPNNSLLSPYWTSRKLIQAKSPVETEQIMGAALMCRRGVELFDERFFLYVEDTDLCKRLRAHGRLLYVHSESVIHELGSSSSASPWKAIARYNRGKEQYFRIHVGEPQALFCLIIDRMGAAGRMLVWTAIALVTLGLKRNVWRQVTCFTKVLLSPLSGPTRS